MLNFFPEINVFKIRLYGTFTDNDNLFPINFLENLENFDEEVDDVKVELNGSHDVLLGTQTSHDHLSVVDDEEAEQKCSSDSHSSFSKLIPNEKLEESTEDEDEKASVERSAKVGEVTLGLESEGSESYHHSGSEEEGLYNYVLVEEGDKNTDGVSFHNGECGQEDQVGWGLLALHMKGHEESEG